MQKILIVFFFQLIGISSFAQPAYIFHEKGEEKFKAGNYLDAIKDFDQAIKASVNNFESYLLRGKSYDKLGDKKHAIENYNLAIKYNPNYTDAYYSRALFEADAGDEKSALGDFAVVLKLNPNYLEVYNYRGLMYVHSGKSEAGMNDFKKAIELNTSNPEVYINMAHLHLKENKINEAETDFTKGIELKPAYANTYFERGKIFLSQKKYKQAAEDFSAALLKGYQKEELFQFRYQVYENLGDVNSLFKDLSTLIDQYKSKDANVYVKRGSIFSSKQDVANALKDFAKAISFDHENGQVYLQRGHLYFKQGKSKIPLAMMDYKKAEELNTTDYELYINSSKTLFDGQKFDLALHDFTEAIKIKPTADLYYKRSMCHYKVGNKKSCCEDVKKAVEMGSLEAKKDIGVVCK